MTSPEGESLSPAGHPKANPGMTDHPKVSLG